MWKERVNMNKEKEIRITSTGYKKLQKELKQLWEKREEIVKDLKIAYDFGDLRENSEFDAAKQRQSLCDKRIKQIEDTLRHATIVNTKNKSIVDIGAKVIVEYLEDKEQITYEIVGKEEVAVEENKVSYESPLGSAVMGKKENDIIAITSPNGEYQVKIIKIMY